MIDDITLNKAAIVRRCVSRVTAEYQGNPSRLDDFTTQYSVVLNSKIMHPPSTTPTP